MAVIAKGDNHVINNPVFCWGYALFQRNEKGLPFDNPSNSVAGYWFCGMFGIVSKPFCSSSSVGTLSERVFAL